MYRCYSGDALLVAASATGRGHLQKNIVCQDKVDFCRKHDTFVLVLADGAGAEQNSHFGAEIAVKAACDYLAENFNSIYADIEGIEARQKISKHVRDKLSELAVKGNIPFKSLASTLLAVAVCDERYIIFHVGDGVIGALVRGGMKLASFPENGEFANSTVFMTSDDVEQYIKLLKGRLNDINGFLLMSDGAANSLFSRHNKQFAGITASIFKIAPVLSSRELEMFIERNLMGKLLAKTQDDCSVGLMMEPENSSMAFKKRCAVIMKNLEKGLSVEKSLQKAGIRKKYHRRYISRLTDLGWIG